MLDISKEPMNLTQMDVQSLWHPMVQHKQYERTPPKRIDKAQGCYVTDEESKEYLDGVSGLWCVNIGYGRKELASVAHEQLVELSYFPLVMSHSPAIKLAAKLLELLKFEGKVHFSNSGSEANEVAFKIARQYYSQISKNGSWRYKIISRYRAYHGNTMGALSATAQAERRARYEPLVPGFFQVHPPYCYRCPFGKTYGSCNIECASSVESTIVHEGAETIAAIIVEPVISGGGVIVPPDEYLPMLRDICDRYGILLIFDEVVSGFGRLGKMFGHEHWNVKPDIITLAKGITSGYLPLSATITQQHIFEAFLDETDSTSHFRHINTYGGNPASTALSLKNIEILETEQLSERATKIGAYLRTKLSNLLDHPYVGDIRGKGLLLGIELVADKQTKEPLAATKVSAIVSRCLELGLIIGRNGATIPGFSNVLILAPPLILTKTDADLIVAILKEALKSQV
ncbi:MAG: aminotransferase [Xenococcaceae cyanobacterium MO_188.B29]|nr:aminotransferase [Xenococcaceae cyanobacterium MO_188.B29]